MIDRVEDKIGSLALSLMNMISNIDRRLKDLENQTQINSKDLDVLSADLQTVENKLEEQTTIEENS